MRSFVIGTLAFAAVFGWIGGSTGNRKATAPEPAQAQSQDWRTPHAEAGTITLDRGWNGHYFVTGDVKGRPLRFIVDTGASTVALSRDNARSVGVDVDHLVFDGEAQTASGRVRVAEVRLPQLRIGDIQLLEVRADVLDMPGSDIALLGQSFLGRIDKVSIEGDRMTLTKL